jgi:hypothetical protein
LGTATQSNNVYFSNQANQLQDAILDLEQRLKLGLAHLLLGAMEAYLEASGGKY